MNNKIITTKNIKRAAILLGSGGILYFCTRYGLDPRPFLELLNNF